MLAHTDSPNPLTPQSESFLTAVAFTGNVTDYGLTQPVVPQASLSSTHQLIEGTDLTVLSFDAHSDYTPLGQTDITFTLQNKGSVAANTFDVALLYSDDAVLGNNDDIVIGTATITQLNSGDTLTRTVTVQLPISILNERALSEHPSGQASDFVSNSTDFLGIQIDPENVIIETNEENNINAKKGQGIDDITYFPWDLDGNRQVTATDAIFVINRVGQSVDSTNAQADLNADGLITATDAISAINRLGYTINPVVTTPTINVKLSNDNGTSDTDNITTDPTLEGIIADHTAVASLQAQFKDTEEGVVETAFIDITNRLDADGRFTLTQDQLDSIYGGPLPDGEHTITLQTLDSADKVTSEFQLEFSVVTHDHTSACAPDESVLTQSSSYSANIDLTASIALPGNQGIDVIITERSAIAAVNTETGSRLYWVNPATGGISQQVTLSSTINDIAFDGSGVLAVAADNKILRLDVVTGDALSEVLFDKVKRVAIAPNGNIAALAGRTVRLYDNNNATVFSKSVSGTEVTDIEILSCHEHNSVYVTSYRNTTFTDLQNRRNPVQIARLDALDFSGNVQWSLFGDRADTIKQNVADTRLYRVTLGKDGYLYIGGESAGTATIFRWRGQPMSEAEQLGRTQPFLTQIDAYSQLYNSGSAHLTYYARVHPTEGRLITSQMSFPRLSSTKSNTMRIGDIAGGSDGSLYFGGAAGASIFNRNNLTLNGESIGSYAGRDSTWLATSPDFKDREFWTVLSENGGKGIVQGVDVGYGYSAALSNVENGTIPTTIGPPTGSVFLSFVAE